ncbi:cytosine permease [Kribbella sp. NPDC050124]|uniref:cytosine permease n=1 Tax=Kribbella sp. NPDC050124 TaxID=3364114 RepID=UPI00379AC3B6
MTDTQPDDAGVESPGISNVTSASVSNALQDHALESVPADRRQSLLQLVVVQVGWNISVSSFLVGGVVGAGVPFWTGVLAVLVGNLVLVSVSTLVGLAGCRTGLTSYLISRAVFGAKGSIVVSVMLGIIAMGFIGVLMDTWGTAVNKLIPAIPSWGFVLAFAVAITSTSIFGFKGLARYSAIAVPIEIAIALFALFKIGSLGTGFGEVIAHTPTAPIGFAAAVGAVIATWITGASLVSDVTRYARRRRDVLISNFVGFVVGAGVFETIAMISAMKVDQSNFVLVMSGLSLLAPAAVMLFLALWNTADNNLYSSSLAFTNASNLIGLRVTKPVWTVVAILVAVTIAFSGASAHFLDLLLVVATVVPPFAGVLVAHMSIVSRRQPPTEMLSTAPSVRWSALVAWGGSAWAAKQVAFLLNDAIEGLLLGVASYLLLSLALAARRDGVSSGTSN